MKRERGSGSREKEECITAKFHEAPWHISGYTISDSVCVCITPRANENKVERSEDSGGHEVLK